MYSSMSVLIPVCCMYIHTYIHVHVHIHVYTYPNVPVSCMYVSCIAPPTRNRNHFVKHITTHAANRHNYIDKDLWILNFKQHVTAAPDTSCLPKPTTFLWSLRRNTCLLIQPQSFGREHCPIGPTALLLACR